MVNEPKYYRWGTHRRLGWEYYSRKEWVIWLNVGPVHIHIGYYKPSKD